jgi:hypothetical protein
MDFKEIVCGCVDWKASGIYRKPQQDKWTILYSQWNLGQRSSQAGALSTDRNSLLRNKRNVGVSKPLFGRLVERLNMHGSIPPLPQRVLN